MSKEPGNVKNEIMLLLLLNPGAICHIRIVVPTKGRTGCLIETIAPICREVYNSFRKTNAQVCRCPLSNGKRNLPHSLLY